MFAYNSLRDVTYLLTIPTDKLKISHRCGEGEGVLQGSVCGIILQSSYTVFLQKKKDEGRLRFLPRRLNIK